MLRLVVDPGVYVSALLSRRGPPFRLIELWDGGACELVVSPGVLAELRAVLARDPLRTRVSASEAEKLLGALERDAVAVEDVPDPPSVTADPKDDYLVALARVAGVDALVSGDAHLVELPPETCRVLRPRQAVELLEAAE